MQYFSREILEQYLERLNGKEILDIITKIEENDSDAYINLIRCRECINRGHLVCPQFNLAPNGDIVDWTEEDSFCSWGEQE